MFGCAVVLIGKAFDILGALKCRAHEHKWFMNFEWNSKVEICFAGSTIWRAKNDRRTVKQQI